MTEATVTLTFDLALASETLMALRARQRASGFGTPEHELCGRAIGVIEEAMKAPDVRGEAVEESGI